MKPATTQMLVAVIVLWLPAAGLVESFGKGAADEAPKKVEAKAPEKAKPAEADVKPKAKEEAVAKQKAARKDQEAKNAAGMIVIELWNVAAAIVGGEEIDPGAMTRNAKDDRDDPMFKQYEKQFTAGFTKLQQNELHFMRTVCKPTMQQFEKIDAEGKAEVKALSKKFAVLIRDLERDQQRGKAPVAGSQPQPRKLVAEGVARSVKAMLSPDQSARYQKELDHRATTTKRIARLCLLAKLDKGLLLSADQRQKLGEVLDKNWNETWNNTAMILNSGDQFPLMPDAKIIPILNETQKGIWNDLPKGDYGNAFDFGEGFDIGDGMALGEVPVEDPKQPEAVEAKDKEKDAKKEEKK